MRHTDQRGAFVTRISNFLRIDVSELVTLDICKIDLVVRRVAMERSQNRVVFENRGDNMDRVFAAGPLCCSDDAVDREIERVGASMCEHNS